MPEVYNAQKAAPKKPPKRAPTDYSAILRQFGPTTNPLTAFMVQPPGVTMSVQEPDEKVLMVLRRHFITNIGWIIVVILMFMAPLLVGLLPVDSLLPARFNLAVFILWNLLTLGIALEGFLSWYYNVFVITDERIIDIDFLNLIYKNVSSAKIDNIEDVTVQMGGAVRNVLNFGTVLMQTAAERNQFEFEDVPHPQEVSKFLNELILEEEREQLEGRVS